MLYITRSYANDKPATDVQRDDEGSDCWKLPHKICVCPIHSLNALGRNRSSKLSLQSVFGPFIIIIHWLLRTVIWEDE